jgi:hypothetical protein
MNEESGKLLVAEGVSIESPAEITDHRSLIVDSFDSYPQSYPR